MPWGGFAAEGILTIARPSETFSRLEWTVDGAHRVLRIVYAVNGLWPPTAKRLAARSADLRVKPERLAERIDDVSWSASRGARSAFSPSCSSMRCAWPPTAPTLFARATGSRGR